MAIEIKADDSRQSVDLKWKLRKGLEEGVDVNSEGDLAVGRNLEVDGDLKLNGSLLDGEGKEKFITAEDGTQEVSWSAPKKLSEGARYISFSTASNNAYIEAGVQGQNFTRYSYRYIQVGNYQFAFGQKSGQIAVTSDIKPLYAHTIMINTPRSASSASAASVGLICFTAYLTNNQVIDSVQDLCALCGNTDYQVSGYIFHGDIQALVKIHVGTSITDSSVTYIGVNGVVNLKLSDVGVTSVSDSVTAVIAPIAAASAKENIWSDEEEMEGDEAESESSERG